MVVLPVTPGTHIIIGPAEIKNSQRMEEEERFRREADKQKTVPNESKKMKAPMP